MPCTAVNNHFLDRKWGSTYRLDCLPLTRDLVSFSALWSKPCEGVNEFLLKCNKIVQSSGIQIALLIQIGLLMMAFTGVL